MKNSKQLRTWLDDMQLEHPLVIAGPCSAETEAQVLKIAHQLKDSDVNYYRAGIWNCLLYTSPSPRDAHESRMPSSA